METKSPVTAPSLSSRAREGPPVTPPPGGPAHWAGSLREGPSSGLSTELGSRGPAGLCRPQTGSKAELGMWL